MQGYGKIAAMMAHYPESAILRRFGHLNAQDLLYRQAELVGLEQDFLKLQAGNDNSADHERKAFSQDWYTLSTTFDEDIKSEQWRLALQIREKLKEYDKAVIRCNRMLSFQEPEREKLSNLQEWFRRPTMGQVYLTGRDRNVWIDGHDLISLRRPERQYPFLNWINSLFPAFHHLIGRHFKDSDTTTPSFATNVIQYDDSKISRTAALLGTIVASLLPVLAIVILYLVIDMPKRLGLVAVFTAIFSACLWFMTEGRMIEVFSATAA